MFSKDELMKINDELFNNVSFGLRRRNDRNSSKSNITFKTKDKNSKHGDVGLYFDFYKSNIKVLISDKIFLEPLKKEFTVEPEEERSDLKYFGEINIDDIETAKRILKICRDLLIETPDEDEIRVNIKFRKIDLDIIKAIANKLDIPYQTYIRESAIRRAIQDNKDFTN